MQGDGPRALHSAERPAAQRDAILAACSAPPVPGAGLPGVEDGLEAGRSVLSCLPAPRPLGTAGRHANGPGLPSFPFARGLRPGFTPGVYARGTAHPPGL